jgi:hypothetical protein
MVYGLGYVLACTVVLVPAFFSFQRRLGRFDHAIVLGDIGRCMSFPGIAESGTAAFFGESCYRIPGCSHHEAACGTLKIGNDPKGEVRHEA